MKSGFVAVVGRPNVGKSSLVNALVGQKVAITSSRPQTTRTAIRGVLHLPDRQIVFVDTPGLHRPRTNLGERLNRIVHGTLEDGDGALFVLDATQKIGPGDRMIAEQLREGGMWVVVASNKTDIATPAAIGAQLEEAAAWEFEAYVPVSALSGDQLGDVRTELEARLPEGPPFFPEGMVSDQPEELLIAEIVREKFLARLRDELPHSLTVVVTGTEERANGNLFVAADLVVERESQKGIVIGKDGELLRVAGSEARVELEGLMDRKVFLQLKVRVEKEWQRSDPLLDRLGF
jgi:GTP-binding protein Era